MPRSIKQLALDYLHAVSTGACGAGALDLSEPAYHLLDAFERNHGTSVPITPQLAMESLEACGHRVIAQANGELSEAHAESLLECLSSSLESHAAWHWIAVPLSEASLSEHIFARDFAVLTGPRDEKVRLLAGLVKMGLEDMEFRAQHIEQSRTSMFFSPPLLVFRHYHQTEKLNMNGAGMARTTGDAIWMLLWTLDEATRLACEPGLRFQRASDGTAPSFAAYFVEGALEWRPMNLRSPIFCRLKLDWLRNPVHQEEFNSVHRLFLSGESRDQLAGRFRKAARFVAEAARSAGCALPPGEPLQGLMLLHMMVAAEVLLLAREATAKLKLAVLLPSVSPLSGPSRVECGRAVEHVYEWRNRFVHSGVEKVLSSTTGVGQTSEAGLVLQMLAQLVRDADSHLVAHTSEASWFAHLNHVWRSTLSLEN